jgi:hypothetical protein
MNYAETESALTKTFGQFSSAIESAPSDGSSNPTRDLSQGPISEKTLSG